MRPLSDTAEKDSVCFCDILKNKLERYRQKYRGGGALPLQILEIKNGNVKEFIGKIITEIKGKGNNCNSNDFEWFSKAIIPFYNNVIYDSYIQYNSEQKNYNDSELKNDIKELYEIIIDFINNGIKKYDENYFKNGGEINLGDTKINSWNGLVNIKNYLNWIKEYPQPIKFPSQIDANKAETKGCLVTIFSIWTSISNIWTSIINQIRETFELEEINDKINDINNKFFSQFNEILRELQGDLKDNIGIHPITRQPLKKIISYNLESPNNIKDCIEVIVNHSKEAVNNNNQDFEMENFINILTEFYSNIVNGYIKITKNLNDDRANPESRGINQQALDGSVINDKNFSTMMLDFTIFLLSDKKESESDSKNPKSKSDSENPKSESDSKNSEDLAYFRFAKKTVELYLPIIEEGIREHNEGNLNLSKIVGKLKDAVNGYKNEVNSANEFLKEQGEKDSLDGKKDSPDGENVSPNGKKDSPDGENVSPNGKKDSPDGENVSPNGKNDSQNSEIDIETLYRKLNDGINEIDKSIQPNGQKNLKDEYSSHLKKIETLTHYFKTIKDIDDEIDRLESLKIKKEAGDGNNKGIVYLLGVPFDGIIDDGNVSAENIKDVYRNIIDRIKSLQLITSRSKT